MKALKFYAIIKFALCRTITKTIERLDSMNRKELSEIKRRLDKNKGNISSIRGCYVTAKGEVVSVFRRPLDTIPEEELKQFFALFRKVLSGTPGKNGIDVVFDADQMTNGEAHPLLMELSRSALSDETAVGTFYQNIIDNYHSEDDFVIMLLSDVYDVPQHASDGTRREDADTVFTYFICCVCPVKEAKTGLAYSAKDQDFRDTCCGKLVGSPELGLMFPAFDDRQSNIYNALYFIRNPEEIHQDFVDAVFHTTLPMTGPEQKNAFTDVLQDALKEDLSFSVMQTVNDRLRENIEVKKQDKTADAPTITAPEVKSILSDCGLPLEKVQAFEDAYESQFGRGVQLNAASIVDTKRMEVRTPNVTIHVDPDFSDMVETRIIDGKKYILIRAEETVEINGISVSIDDDQQN